MKGERSTNEIVADLRLLFRQLEWPAVAREAADRLVELEEALSDREVEV